MFSNPRPGEEPTCDCGARLDAEHPERCRKCSARNRWQRRRANAARRNGPGRKGRRTTDRRRPA